MASEKNWAEIERIVLETYERIDAWNAGQVAKETGLDIEDVQLVIYGPCNEDENEE
jgi:Fe2+ or Zn2+ uptake regulation protein